MEQELEVAQAYVASKNYESAFNILRSLGFKILFLAFIKFQII